MNKSILRKLRNLIIKEYKKARRKYGEKGKDEYGNNVIQITFNALCSHINRMNYASASSRLNLAMLSPKICGYEVDIDKLALWEIFVFYGYIFTGGKVDEKVKEEFFNYISRKSVNILGKVSTIAKADYWDIVYYGSCYQDNNSAKCKKTIAWRVLAVENDRVLLISDKILDSKPYNTEKIDVTWKTCTLRKWLNTDFLNEAFTFEEKIAIAETTISDEDAFHIAERDANATKDRIFILSYEDVEKYFASESAGKAKGTAIAINNGLWVNLDRPDKGFSNWLIRSNCGHFGHCKIGYVFICGDVAYNYYFDVNKTDLGVRPALWVYRYK